MSITTNYLLLTNRIRLCLHYEIIRRARHRVFIRASVNHWGNASEVVVRRRRLGRPLQGRCLPRILLRTTFTLEHAPEKIEEENELRQESHYRRDSYKKYERVQRLKKQINLLTVLSKARIAARHTDYAHYVHRYEDGIDANESYPEMYPAQTLAHKASEYFWKPEIDACEHSEYRHDTHH